MEAARYLSIVKRWWWLLIVGTLMSVAAYGIASRIRDRVPPSPEFSALTTVFVAGQLPAEGGALPASENERAVANDRLVQSYAEMIRGPGVALRMIERLGLQSSVGEVQRSIDVITPPGTQLIQVTTTARTPEDAERLATGVVQSFITLHDEARLPGSTYVSGATPAHGHDAPSRTPTSASCWSWRCSGC